jgi:hypothetical protein
MSDKEALVFNLVALAGVTVSMAVVVAILVTA